MCSAVHQVSHAHLIRLHAPTSQIQAYQLIILLQGVLPLLIALATLVTELPPLSYVRSWPHLVPSLKSLYGGEVSAAVLCGEGLVFLIDPRVRLVTQVLET